MERRIQLAEDRSSSKRDSEADELRRELEEARIAERMAKIQLEETRAPLSPSLPPSTASTSNFTVPVSVAYCACLVIVHDSCSCRLHQEHTMLQLTPHPLN